MYKQYNWTELCKTVTRIYYFIDANKGDGLVDESCKFMQDFVDVSFHLFMKLLVSASLLYISLTFNFKSSRHCISFYAQHVYILIE